ncbi:5-(carboxyamino)imidazole ribonucleotide synthase [Taibaiella sp. KBW10]|uniref:5-(carboxyamino)imidazole ribonucleotide synthase n=1 Tax=Taibaiella sp. KBW10 TaxID=2153357 RepID=UPI000F59E1D8|nr:5-(carboxyamino)imidazole ribonucleotide synthase [Taibaiella sp. KBW10]RQO30651.1 5-(carboxyamino)imidazole ribonucleotide synthase [Taibaiella sp. KBW10]
MSKQITDVSIGLLGGGQLGRMLLQEALNWNLNIAILEPSKDAPCAHLVPDFTTGDFKDYDTVYQFGKDKDIITIEFEDVNSDALAQLEKEGVQVFPQPSVLKIIQDKGLQKQFYQDHNIPTAPFALVAQKSEIAGCGIALPFFQKLRTSGYDGYGVKKIATEADLATSFDQPAVIEAMADMEKELSVIVSRNSKGETAAFPVVEMEFNPESNMVQYLFAPAQIDENIATQATELALTVITKLNMVGILAVEMFYNKDGSIWVNEVAPRPHNSGHHTIEANLCSQYEQHLRAILNLTPGNTDALHYGAMVNLLGEKGYEGTPVYEGIEEVLSTTGAFVHLYGKAKTKSFRKMGHITVVGSEAQAVKDKANKILATIKVKA